MIPDDGIADDLIAARSKRSSSYHREYGRMTFAEIKELASRKRPPDRKAKQMKKLIVDTHLLSAKKSKQTRPRH